MLTQSLIWICTNRHVEMALRYFINFSGTFQTYKSDIEKEKADHDQTQNPFHVRNKTYWIRCSYSTSAKVCSGSDVSSQTQPAQKCSKKKAQNWPSMIYLTIAIFAKYWLTFNVTTTAPRLYLINPRLFAFI